MTTEVMNTLVEHALDNYRVLSTIAPSIMLNGPTQILFHIGFHKTGSTWLQKRVFDKPENGFLTQQRRHEIVWNFATPDAFDFSPAETREKYCDLLERAHAQGCVPVISHERLSGYPASAGYDRRLIADRIAGTFPEASILIAVREQVDLIRSMFKQYITDGGCLSLKRFLHAHDTKLGRMPLFRYQVYEYHRIVEYYQSLFGKHRVLVLPFELLVREPQAFVDRVTDFCGRPRVPISGTKAENLGRTWVMQWVQRQGNCYLSSNELSPASIINVPRFPKRFGRLTGLFRRMSISAVEKYIDRLATDRIVAFARGKYEESNDITSQLIGMDLSEFGYSSQQTGHAPQ